MATLISVGQVLDQSLEHCRKHYKELLAITLWMVVASIPSIIGKLLAPTGGDPALTAGDWLSFSFSMVGVLLATIISIWAYAALVLTVAEQASGKKLNLKNIYRQSWKLFLPYVLLTICLTAIIIGIALLAAPGIALLMIGSGTNAPAALTAIGTPLLLIGAALALGLIAKYSIELAFAPFILLLGKQGVVASIKGSIALVKGRWWATCLRFVVPKLVYSLIVFVVSFVSFKALEILIALVSSSSGIGTLVIYTFSLLLSVFFSVIATPLIIATDYYLYDSLRKTR